jgi:hypothetical protein
MCEACDRAATNPRTGHFRADCMACEARALAQGPAAHVRQKDPAELQAAMRKAWPKEMDYRAGRLMVWGWIETLEGRA